MKKKIITIGIIVFVISMFPIKFGYKDGGSTGYKSLTYRITNYYALPNEENKALRGIIVEILGFEVYDGTYYVEIPIQE